MARRVPQYFTPADQTCPVCKHPCKIIPDRTDFDHEQGTEYPPGWGKPVSDCCDEPIHDAEADEGPY